MKHQQSNILILSLLIISLFFSCDRRKDVIVQGMAGIYIDDDDFSEILRIDPIPPVNLGGIVNVGNYIFLNEKLRGIHVVDNTDPINPQYIHFWSIPGNTQFTILEDALYADNTIHLIIIDISDFNNIQYLDHIEDLYLADDFAESAFYPFNYFGPFECYNKDKGILTGWKNKELLNPACRAY